MSVYTEEEERLKRYLLSDRVTQREQRIDLYRERMTKGGGCDV